MNISTYKKGDERQIVWLINNTWRDAYSDIFPSEVFDERDKTADGRIDEFEDKIKRNNRICFVAEENEKIVGVLIGSYCAEIESFDNKNYASVRALYVDKNFQHKGIGKDLFDNFVDEIKKKGKTKFIIGVLEKNSQARKAYEKWGGVLTDYIEEFTVTGVSRKEVFYQFNVKTIEKSV